MILIAFPLQNWLHERVRMLRSAYMACLAFRHQLCDIFNQFCELLHAQGLRHLTLKIGLYSALNKVLLNLW